MNRTTPPVGLQTLHRENDTARRTGYLSAFASEYSDDFDYMASACMHVCMCACACMHGCMCVRVCDLDCRQHDRAVGVLQTWGDSFHDALSLTGVAGLVLGQGVQNEYLAPPGTPHPPPTQRRQNTSLVE